MTTRVPEAAAVVWVCGGGPLLVRGDFELREIADGRPIDARRTVIALCRCGRSRIKPFCDGSHATPAGSAGSGGVVVGPAPADPSERPDPSDSSDPADKQE